MKKEIKKLSLNKKTISNLSTTEMSRQMGGLRSYYGPCGGGGNGSKQCSVNASTCAGHNTCQYNNSCQVTCI